MEKPAPICVICDRKGLKNSNKMKHFYYLLLVLLVSGCTSNADEVIAPGDNQIEWAEAQQYDVIVIGGTPAGIAAAIAAGRAKN